jgi:hypothetical protein
MSFLRLSMLFHWEILILLLYGGRALRSLSEISLMYGYSPHISYGMIKLG